MIQGCTCGTMHRICVYVCVTDRGRGFLTGDLKLECTLLNFENGVLGREWRETIN